MGCRMGRVKVGHLTGAIEEKGQRLTITRIQTNGWVAGRTTRAEHPAVINREGSRPGRDNHRVPGTVVEGGSEAQGSQEAPQGRQPDHFDRLFGGNLEHADP